MNVWRSGRESNLLDDIIMGRKTIEGRLNRDKFAEYAVDDEIYLRRDYRDTNGVLRDGKPDVARVKIIAISAYDSFIKMLEKENYSQVIPSATSAEEAAAVYDTYYTVSDQEMYGVLAIEVCYLKP